ncbi:MAG TPA: hypothetical protein VMO81_00970 [Aestuariivirgaceae bacterium]|nr:hypothetical protein [Aestuariivirgaceae bacterium]
MTQLRNTFDAESLGALESVLNDIDRELASEPTVGEEEARPAISRERLAKLILHYAQDGESDPAKLRALVLKGIGRD